jgi:3,4-dihydroxy 2-butanone 4-phosphate synthase/GTP cyclohydrolase II
MPHTIEDAIADFRDGRMLILTDDEKRENEGDFRVPQSQTTQEKIN